MNQEKKVELFFKSKHFCSVPWNHFYVFTNGDLATCVKGAPLDNIHNIDIKDFVKTNSLCSIRENLFNDILDANCKKCQAMEGENFQYLRGLYNPLFREADVNYSDNTEFKLQGVDLHWGSTCQLKCVTCWARSSSSIAKEENKPILSVDTDRADQIIDFIIENQGTLKEIYMSGGEPTLINHNLRLLQKLDIGDFRVRVNTNMMFNENNKIIEELKRFPNVLITISADAIEERFEYIRRGASWSIFIDNLTRLQDNFSWRVNSVFFVGSALQLTDTQEFFMKNFGITDFTINQVAMEHDDIRCRNLDDIVKLSCAEKLYKHKQKYPDENLIGQIDNCLIELQEKVEETYIPFFENVDKKAGTNWQNIFPELV